MNKLLVLAGALVASVQAFALSLHAPASKNAGEAYTVSANHWEDNQFHYGIGVQILKNGAYVAGNGSGGYGYVNVWVDYNTSDTSGPVNYQATASGGNGNYSATATVQIVSPNNPPTITWVQAPGSAPVNQWFAIQARGNDQNGNLTNVFVWREWSPHAFNGGGNGYESYSDANSYAHGSAGSVTFMAQAQDSNGATSPVIYHTVNIYIPNVAPTISWNIAPPDSAWVNQVFTVQAVANDGNGNMTWINVWRAADGGADQPFAFNGGGNGSTAYSDNNATSKNAPGTLTFKAQAGDSSGATSPVISKTVTINNRAPTITMSASPTTINFGQTTNLTSVASDADSNLSFHGILVLNETGSNWYRSSSSDHSTGWGNHATTADFTAISYSSGVTSGWSSTRTATHRPSYAGTFTYHNNTHDGVVWASSDAGNWAACVGYAYVTVNKATPNQSGWSNRTWTGTGTAPGGSFNVTFSNPYTTAVAAPTGAPTFTIIGVSGAGASPTSGTVSAGTVFTPGTYTIRCSYPGDPNYSAADWNATFTVNNVAPTAAMSIKGISSGTTTGVINETLSISVSGADSDANLRAVNLWVATPTVGWRNIRADSSLNGGFVENATTDNAINSATNVATLGSVNRNFHIPLGGGTGTYQFVVRSIDAPLLASTSQQVNVSVVKANQPALILNAATPQTYGSTQLLSTSGGAGGGAVTYAIVAQSSAGVATLTGNSLKANAGSGWADVQATKAEDGNYNATVSAPVRVNFAKAPLSIKADNKTRTFGEANPVFTATYVGLVNGDTSAVVSGLTLTTAATSASSAGQYDIIASGGSAANYNITHLPGTLTVTRKRIYFSFENTTLVYNAAEQKPTVMWRFEENGTPVPAPLDVWAYRNPPPSPPDGRVYATSAMLKNAYYFEVEGTGNYYSEGYGVCYWSIVCCIADVILGSNIGIPGEYSYTYDGSSKFATATTANPPGLNVVITYNGVETPLPVNAGTYAVHAEVSAPVDQHGQQWGGHADGTLVIAKANQAALTLASTFTQTYNTTKDLNTLLTATGSGNGVVSYAIVGQSAVGTLASISGSVLTAHTGTGWVDIQATKATGTDGNYHPTTSTNTLRVTFAKANQPALTINVATTQTYLDTQTLSATGGASDAGALSYSIRALSATGAASLSGAVLTANTGTGWVEVRATRAGNNNYNVRYSNTVRVNLAKKVTTPVLSGLVHIYDGNPKSVTVSTTPSSLPVVVTYDGSETVPTNAKTYMVSGIINHVNYQGISNVQMTIHRATPVIQWPPPAAITWGTPLGSGQLNAGSPTTIGTFFYDPVAGTVLEPGSHTLNVTFNAADTTNYVPGVTANVPLTVNKITPVITWAAPAAITYGNLLGADQLNATASTTGTFVYDPAANALLTPNTYTLNVTFNASDTAHYVQGVTANVPLTVGRAMPAATFSGGSWLGGTHTLAAGDLNAVFFHPNPGSALVAAPSGGVSYAIINATGPTASPTSGAVAPGTVLQTGTYTIRASYAGDTNYDPRTIDAEFTVIKNDPPALTMQILDESDVVLASRQSVAGVETGAVSATVYFGQKWKLALAASDPDKNLTTLFPRFRRPLSMAGSNPAPTAWTWNPAEGYYYANVTIDPTAAFTWISPEMVADQVGTWDSWAHAHDSMAVPFGSITTPPWTGDEYGWQTINEPNLIVAKATPAASFADRVLPVPAGSSHTIQAGDLNASFTNPYGTAVAAPGGAVNYSVVTSGGTTPISAGSTLTSGIHVIRASYQGDGNYESVAVEARFAVGAQYVDTDGDGMPDMWEDEFGLNKNLNDAAGDLDGDGMSNWNEYHHWRDPSRLDPFGGSTEVFLGANVSITALAKGNGSVTLTKGALTYTFQFTAAPGNEWSKATANPPAFEAYGHFINYGQEDTFQVSSSGVTDFYIKTDVGREMQRQALPIVEIDGRLTEGITKNEIQGGQFSLRARPEGMIPFGVMDASNLNVTRTVEFGLGGGRAGRSAGRVLLTLGTWRSDMYLLWGLSFVKGETMEGSHETPTRFQAKVPAGYVDVTRERFRIAVRYYNDSTPFVAGAFRDFTGVTPVAAYNIDLSQTGAIGSTPIPTRLTPTGGWSAGTGQRITITRTVGGISHLFEHETHWLISGPQGESSEYVPALNGSIVSYGEHRSTVTRIWPWRLPVAPRDGLTRVEFSTTDSVVQYPNSPPTRNKDIMYLDTTSYVGASEASAVANHEFHQAGINDFWFQYAGLEYRGLGADQHEVPRRLANSTGPYKQNPVVQTNGLGGGTFTEYLSLGSGINASHNLEGQPFIALGQPKRVRATFGDDALHSATDLISTYSYHPELIDGLAQTWQVVTKQGTTDVAKKVYTYTTGTLNSLPTLTTQVVSSVSSTQTLTTTTRAYSRRIADPDMRGKILAVTRPDGTKTSYAYQRGTLSGSGWSANPSGQHFLAAELNGKTGTAVSSYGSIAIDTLDLDANRSTVTERIFDVGGRLLREASYVYNGGGFTLLDATYSGYDAFGQLTIRADQPITGSPQAGRILYEAAYLGFQKQWERDAQGITTIYTYDGYGRIGSKKRQGASHGGHYIADTTTVYVYDGSGRLTTETQTGVGESDRLVSSYTYDTASRPKSQTAPGGFTTSINYDSATQKSITLPGDGTRMESVYKDGRPKAVSGSAVPDASTSYTFLPSGFLKTTRTTAGQTVVENKDWLGRVDTTETATWGGATRIAKNNYNTVGQLASQEVKVNNVKVALDHLYLYDSYGRLYREGLDADNNGVLDPVADFGVKEYETHFQTGAPGYGSNVYRYAGQKVWPYAGTKASTSRYASQTYTQVTGLTATMAGHTVALDADRNKTDTTQTLNRTARLLETATTATGTTQTILEKNLNGLTVSTTSAQGQTTLQTYDGLGRPEATNDPRIGTTSVSYVTDTALVYSVISPDWKATYSSYDTSGRLAAQTDNAGKTAWFKYDAAGNLTHTWGDTVNPVKYEYNELGQRTKQRTYRSGTWTGASLPGGFAGSGDETTWNFQASTGLLISKVDAAGTTAYQYDDMARVKKRTDARGWVTNYTYTAAGLPWVTDYQDSVTADVTYTYDRAGRVDTVTDGTGVGGLPGTRSFSYYDSWGNDSYEAELRNKSARLQTETFTSGFYGSGRSLTYDYQYEVAGRANGPQLTLKIDNGSLYTVGYAYDAVGRLNSVSYNSVTPFAYTYVPNSNLVDTVAQGITGYKRDYDYESKSDRVETLKNHWAAVTASTVESRLTYDLIGRRNTEKLAGTAWMTALGRGSEPGVHLDYTYTDRSEVDSSGRYLLTAGWGVGAFRPGTDRDFTYDAMGNRTADIIAGVAGTYSPNGLNQYVSAPGMASSSYDANGNLTSDGTRTYEYDGENRLIKITQGGSVWNYAYDYLGRRVRKWGTGILEQRFIYDGWNLIAETDGSGVLTRRYAWGLDVSGTLQGAGGVGGLLLIQDGSVAYYPLYDASHNVVGLYNASGGFAAAYEYDPFGRPVTSAGTYAAANPFRFSTKYTDNETSLVYYGYRYYSPLIGRFINRDPIGEEGGINLYGFCGNDGINKFDYLGLDDTIYTGGRLDDWVVDYTGSGQEAREREHQKAADDAIAAEVQRQFSEDHLKQYMNDRLFEEIAAERAYAPDSAGNFFTNTFLNAGTFRDAAQLHRDLQNETHLGWKISGYVVLGIGVTAGVVDAASNFTGVKGLAKAGFKKIAGVFTREAAENVATRQLTVIGHAPDYIKVAQAKGANYLKWSENWNFQKQGDFIKSVIQRGDDVLIGTPIRPGESVLRHEIKQLIKAGYEPVEQGSLLLRKTN